eukprot:5936719-Pleurochrysis_carterae.AAC.1
MELSIKLITPSNSTRSDQQMYVNGGVRLTANKTLRNCPSSSWLEPVTLILSRTLGQSRVPVSWTTRAPRGQHS